MTDRVTKPNKECPFVDLSAFDAAALDLDGVITQTASLHAAAWKQLFDSFLERRAARTGQAFQPFDIECDYREYVDGKPRHKGVVSFLASRGISLPEGGPEDPPDAETVRALGKQKNDHFHALLAQRGVAVFEGSVALLHKLRQAGLKTAVVSASESTAGILAAAGLSDLFDVRVDGIEAASKGLKGKPAPDTFLYAARLLGTSPDRMLGVEDSMAGIEALSAARFGLIIGIERREQGRALIERGATFVVRDLADLRLSCKDRQLAVGVTAGERRAQTLGMDLPASPTSDAAWTLVEEGFVLSREHEIESLFAIGNGFVGTRASLAEGSALSAPATFLAGLFDQRSEATPGLVALPDWTRLSVVLEGEPIRLDVGRNLEHRRILDMRQGILWREWRHQDAAGRITRLRGLRLASLADRRLLIQSVALSAENYSGTVSIDMGLGESVSRATHRGVTVALAAATRLRGVESPETGGAMPSQSFEVELGKAYRLDRVVAICTSSDTDHPLDRAREQAERAIATGLERLIDEHRNAWSERWRICDITIDGDPAAQHALRFAAYHLVSAANPEDGRVSIGARGLTGEAYRGHVFWDTEIFMLPFFNLTWPEAANALLSYRHHTLDAARRRAARLGYRGALYAWESADTGEDVTPPLVVAPTGEVMKILSGEQEQHISADIAYAVWSYWQATHDEEFLVDAGAEIIFETARFWATRARRETDGRYHIRNVIGPDEYHETVDDNAYTNGMAQWTLETGERLARLLAERWPSNWRALSDRLHLAPQEPVEWLSLARHLYTGFDERTGLIEQFQGYYALEEIDLRAFEPRNVPMDVLLGRERIQGSKIIKQADVVMLLFLLWDRFPPAVREVNFRYYEPRCGHGSSLSPAIHAAVAARLGDGALAERYFRQAMDIDLANNMGNAAGGVHLAALGGLWQAAVFGFAGLQIAGEQPERHPKLPPQWRGLSMRFKWRGQEHELKLSVERGSARELAEANQ